MPPSEIVFLPGASLPAWIWDDVIERLPGTRRAIELPGRESEATRREATLDDLVDAAATRALQGARVTLVGHSIGGLVASGIAAKHPGRVARVVYVGSYLPPRGKPFLSHAPAPLRVMLRALYMVKPGGMVPPPGALRQQLCNGLDEKTTERVLSAAMTEAPALFTGRVGWDAPRIPTTYVRLTDDRAVTHSTQDEVIARLGSAAVEEIPSGHLPMLSHPDALAAILTRALGSPA